MRDFHVAYRPTDFDQVLGQGHVVESLRSYEKANDWPHAFLFTGSSGCGKTTLARIVASKLQAASAEIMEVDAATFNGIETMRALTSDLNYKGFGESDVKFIILDECHQLSKSAWNALLKTIEEPPSHVYFSFCTTEPDKVPETIKTRCIQYNLKSVPYSDLLELIAAIAELEELDIPEDGLKTIAREALGSPRRALTSLSKCSHCTTLSEVTSILETTEENIETIELCRALAGRVALDWRKAIRLIRKLDEKNPESVRLTIVNYTAKALMNTEASNDAEKFLAILDAFSKPFNPSEKMAPLLLAVGQLIFGASHE